MVAGNFLLMVVLLGMRASGIAVTGSAYSACPELATENLCMCSDEGKITIPGNDGAVESCISFLQNNQPLKFRELHVIIATNLSLPQNWLGDTQFDSVFIYEANVVSADPNFLGASAGTIRNLTFRGGSLGVFPTVNSSSLEIFSTYGTQQLGDVPSDAFTLTPQLKVIELIATLEGPSITINSGALSPLYQLERFVLRSISAVNLAFGAVSISSPFLQTVEIMGTVTIASGALSGFPPGSEFVMEKYDGFWSQEIFYDLLSGGATMRTRDAQPCECDMAWLRYSAFVHQVDGVRCYTGFYPASPQSLDFLDCPIRDLDQDMLQNCY